MVNPSAYIGTEKLYNLVVETQDFYTLYYLAEVKKDRKARELFNWYKTIFARQLADYCTLICFGEARHSAVSCSGMINEIEKSEKRETIYVKAAKFKRDDTIRKIKDLFYKYDWDGEFGGPNWGNIAETVLQYWTGKLTPVLFIDRVIWLEHNGGAIFNKPAIFRYDDEASPNQLRIYLDRRGRVTNPLVLNIHLSPAVQKIAKWHEGFNCRMYKQNSKRDKPLTILKDGYTPITWDEDELKVEIVDNPDWNKVECEECGELFNSEELKEGLCKNCYEDYYYETHEIPQIESSPAATNEDDEEEEEIVII